MSEGTQDVVARLRADKSTSLIFGGTNVFGKLPPTDLDLEAADLIDALSTALEPFVNHLERTEAAYTEAEIAAIKDEYETADGITWGDLRRARAALSPASEPKT